MAWRGNLKRMGKLAENLGELARVPSRAAKFVAENIATLIDQEFDAQADPYGKAWKPHAAATVERWGEHPILNLTGAMRESVDVKPMRSAGVSITIDHPAAPHQTGWNGPQGKGPARPILPNKKMPDLWRESIDAAYDSLVKKAMKGAT